MSGIASACSDIIQGIKNLPSLIVDGIKGLFVPDTAVIEAKFNDTMGGLKERLGIDVFDMDSLFSASSAPDDIEGSYSVGGFSYSGKFVDFTYLIQAVDKLRPYIRGFIVLLLFFFNIRQALGMFGLHSGEIASASNGGNSK